MDARVCSLNRVSFGLNLTETAAGKDTHYLAKRWTKHCDYAFDSALRLRHRRPAAPGAAGPVALISSLGFSQAGTACLTTGVASSLAGWR